MQWSKLRIRMLDFVAPAVRKRIDFHLTYYRGFGSTGQEFWITIDQQKVFSASYGKANIAAAVLSRRTGLSEYGDGPDQNKLDDILTRRAIHQPTNVTSSIRTYFDIDPQVAITSSDPILRSLAIIDRRVGKRTLDTVCLSKDEHPLVKAFYKLRIESLSRSEHQCA